MNDDFDFRAKRTAIILGVMCLIFFIIIIKAFEYLPKNNPKPAAQEIITQNTSTPEETAQEEPVQEEQPQPERKTLNISFPQPAESQDIETIETPQLESIPENPEDNALSTAPQEDPIDSMFAQALKFKQEKQYIKAFEIHKKILSMTDDTNIKARCYEEIATIYAIEKRYGSALSFAQKAYNTNPTSSREMLLARLYYKTGDIDKATTRVNNILQRDFASDRE